MMTIKHDTGFLMKVITNTYQGMDYLWQIDGGGGREALQYILILIKDIDHPYLYFVLASLHLMWFVCFLF